MTMFDSASDLVALRRIEVLNQFIQLVSRHRQHKIVESVLERVELLTQRHHSRHSVLSLAYFEAA